jgi:hypothetical protein
MIEPDSLAAPNTHALGAMLLTGFVRVLSQPLQGARLSHHCSSLRAGGLMAA